jgi:hypothetical protein
MDRHPLTKLLLHKKSMLIGLPKHKRLIARCIRFEVLFAATTHFFMRSKSSQIFIAEQFHIRAL